MSTEQQGDRRGRRRAANDCRSGKHRFGSGHALAGGIVRQVCMVCGAVSIDITSSDETQPRGLFAASDRGDHAR